MARTHDSLSTVLARMASTVRVPSGLDRVTSSPRRRVLRGGLARHARWGDVPGARSMKLARVEAVLFAAGEPLSTRRIAHAANLSDGAEARVLIQELKNLYDRSASSFTVLQLAGGWQLRARPEFSAIIEHIHSQRHEGRLSQPALETLAVVAYRQPILRADIESIRGVSCGEMLRQLVDRGLVRIVGHHDSLGRPLLYGTTRKFLEVFGLADLGELPLAEQLRAAAQPTRGAIPQHGGDATSGIAAPSDSSHTAEPTQRDP